MKQRTNPGATATAARRAGSSDNVASVSSIDATVQVREWYGESKQPYTFRLSHDGSASHIEPSVAWRCRLSLMSLFSFCRSVFLPIGFPYTTTPDYLEFQIYDTLQAVCSYLRGMLCTRAVLTGMGVGEATASATSAALQWFMLDGIGMMGGLMFAYGGSKHFGSDVKRWRLFADIINDFGLTCELLSSLVPKYLFLPVLSVAHLSRALCGVSSGATRAALLQHFALADNGSDLAAKEGIQETFVTLLGMTLGALIMHLMDSDTTATWILFVALTVLHVYTNWKAVKALVLTTLNDQRLDVILNNVVGQIMRLPSGKSSLSPIALRTFSPSDVATRESIIRLPDLGPQIKIGVAMHQTVSAGTLVAELVRMQQNAKKVCGTEADLPMYIICPLSTLAGRWTSVAVILHTDATDRDVLEAVFEAFIARWIVLEAIDGASVPSSHSSLPSILRSAVHIFTSILLPASSHSRPRTSLSTDEWKVLTRARQLTATYFPSFVQQLQEKGWKTQNILLSAHMWRCEWETAGGDEHNQLDGLRL